MSVLLLRLAGPMQAWGTQSRFEIRDSGTEPSKSGVIGLICAALGLPRSEPVDHLAELRMGVRADFEGTMEADYQTAGATHRIGEKYGVYIASGGKPRNITSKRYYLADADFLVGLEGNDRLLEQIQKALAWPTWPLFLGRKPFVPGVPVHIPDSLKTNMSLVSALIDYPWPREDRELPPARLRPERLRLVVETSVDQGEEVRRDQPVGAAFLTRSFAPRYVKTETPELGTHVPVRSV